MASWTAGLKSQERCDVAAMLDGHGFQGVRELVEAGALVSLGLTSEGGAMGVTVTVDGEWLREYFRSQDDLIAWFAQVIPAVDGAKNGGNGPSSAPRPRSRGRRTP